LDRKDLLDPLAPLDLPETLGRAESLELPVEKDPLATKAPLGLTASPARRDDLDVMLQPAKESPDRRDQSARPVETVQLVEPDLTVVPGRTAPVDLLAFQDLKETTESQAIKAPLETVDHLEMMPIIVLALRKAFHLFRSQAATVSQLQVFQPLVSLLLLQHQEGQ